jgi:serine/threonine protein kinase
VSDHLRDRVIAAVGEHYLIEAELGRGGMAAVYGALDLRLNRKVAIKVLPPEHAFNEGVRSRFVREAQMAARLSHPNIVPIYSVDEKDGLVFFVMALVDGESLALRLTAGTLEPQDVRTIVSSVADALDYAHKQGLVHRDVKPDNILLDRKTQRPMVTDFGIARAAAEEHRLTVTGMAVGTPAYMSPEQAMGEREVDGRSDIYSLGIVAYQMLAGETPFRATNTPSMLMKHVSEPPPPLMPRRPDAPVDLVRAVERSLAKRPEDRWRTAADMRDAVLGKLDPHHSIPLPPQRYEPAQVPQSFPFRVEPHAPVAQPIASASQHPGVMPWPQLPQGLTRREQREWYREQRRMFKDAVRAGFAVPEMPVEFKIAKFRRNLLSYGGVTAMLFVINAATGGFPWFIFPALGMAVGLVRQVGSLWGDGIPFRKMFIGSPRDTAREYGAELAPLAAPQQAIAQRPQQVRAVQPRPLDLSFVPPEVQAGPHGAAIIRAATSRATVDEMLSRMTKGEREMLPVDLENTVRALVDRAVSVGTTLHRLDADANGSSLGSLDQRIAGLKAEPAGTERDRRLALLERQRATLGDLLQRRSALLGQFESATVALENLKLDLVRFRSAGVSSAIEDVSSATREARAVSREIGNLLDAHDEVRKI